MVQQVILVVEDDLNVAEGIRRTLQVDGLNVAVAHNGLRALEWLAESTPSLIIADITMPGMNGYQLYQRVRSNPNWMRIPFIFLTARAESEDIRYGKELGVDDYLTKPIEPEDLLAAVRGRLFRYEQLGKNNSASSREHPAGRYAVGKLIVDLGSWQVVVDDREVKLSPTEFNVLQRLILANGAVVEYDELLGYEDDQVIDIRDTAELLRYHIRNLRQKIKDAGETDDLIKSVRNMGYCLTVKSTRVQ
jgi:two-component system response regulator VanR